MPLAAAALGTTDTPFVAIYKQVYCCSSSNLLSTHTAAQSSLDTGCRAGQHNSYASGSDSKAAGSGGQGHSDHHPPALLPPVPNA